jgi:hypothetical protein
MPKIHKSQIPEEIRNQHLQTYRKTLMAQLCTMVGSEELKQGLKEKIANVGKPKNYNG